MPILTALIAATAIALANVPAAAAASAKVLVTCTNHIFAERCRWNGWSGVWDCGGIEYPTNRDGVPYARVDTLTVRLSSSRHVQATVTRHDTASGKGRVERLATLGPATCIGGTVECETAGRESGLYLTVHDYGGERYFELVSRKGSVVRSLGEFTSCRAQ